MSRTPELHHKGKAVQHLVLAIGFFGLLLVPGLAISHYFVSGAASVFVFGALPAAAAYFGGAPRAALPAIGLSVISGSLAYAFRDQSVLSALLMATVAVIIGLSARRGLSSPILIVGMNLGFLILTPQELESSNQVLSAGILLALGGIWAVVVSTLVRKRLKPSAATGSKSLRVIIPYALSLGISTGLATYFLMVYAPGGVGAWLVLTIFVVLKPDTSATISKTRDRILGTIAGAIIAFIAIEVLAFLGLNHGGVQLTIALLFMGASMAYFVQGPYWLFVLLLTPGMVLLDSNNVNDQISVDEWRVAYTIIGVALALSVAYALHLLTTLLLRKREITQDQ